MDESVTDKSQNESFADETMYEDIEYLDENDLEYMECIEDASEEIQFTNVNSSAIDTEITSDTDCPAKVRSYIKEVFLFLVLCLLFLANTLAKYVNSFNVIKKLSLVNKDTHIQICNISIKKFRYRKRTKKKSRFKQ